MQIVHAVVVKCMTVKRKIHTLGESWATCTNKAYSWRTSFYSSSLGPPYSSSGGGRVPMKDVTSHEAR